MMMAQQAGLEPGEFVWTGGDCHVYDNHVDQFLEQLEAIVVKYGWNFNDSHDTTVSPENPTG